MVSLLTATFLAAVATGCVLVGGGYDDDPPVTTTAPTNVERPGRAPRTRTTPTTFLRRAPVHEARSDDYEITGRTLRELSRAMDRQGLVDPADQKPIVAQTLWNISWTWGDAPWQFDARSIEVTVTTTVKMPRWTPPPRADPGVVATWSGFVDSLGKHERKHVAIAQGYADAIPGFVESQSPRSYEEANDWVELMISRCSQDQIALDVTTNHGETEGAGRARWR